MGETRNSGTRRGTARISKIHIEVKKKREEKKKRTRTTNNLKNAVSREESGPFPWRAEEERGIGPEDPGQRDHDVPTGKKERKREGPSPLKGGAKIPSRQSASTGRNDLKHTTQHKKLPPLTEGMKKKERDEGSAPTAPDGKKSSLVHRVGVGPL